MKILHLAQDLQAARVPSRAIHGIAQNVTLMWAGTPGIALDWLRQHTDAAAVIVEVEAQSCAPFLREIRHSRLSTPVVVVDGSGRLDGAVAAVNAGADGYLPAGAALERELPEVVVEAIDRATTRTAEHTAMAAELDALRRQVTRESRLAAALQEQCLQLEAALATLEKRRATEASAFADLLETRHRTFAEQLVQLSESRNALAAQLAATTSALNREREARTADTEAATAALTDAAERSTRLEDLLIQETRRRTDLEQTVSALRAAHDDETARLQQSLHELHAAFQQLDAVAADHAAVRLRLEALVAERDRQLAEKTERHLATEEDAQRAIARLQSRLRQVCDEREREAAQWKRHVEGLRHDLEVTRGHAEALRGPAERAPQLAAQLERTHREMRRRFERAPYALCRCSADGAIVEANHSFVALLGYRRAEDLRNLSWLTVTKERTGDLGWLLERARATRKAETVETQWNTREGRRVIVRLQAFVTPSGAIEILAEDVTTVRALEARLRQAQKMEAVGRLASEVAVTCDALLGDVVRETRDWTDTAEAAGSHMRADRIVEDVTKAQEFLRRLGSYGDEQKRALEPVSVRRVLHDLAPVLKRLVGEQIELVLPKSSGAYPVDVDPARLERILTNVAAYARDRMTTGGQVRIDLATIAIGRRFAAGHSNVRAGDHVLITVTELASVASMHADMPRQPRSGEGAGMELGVLVDLISSCGGHLWLEAQPAGNMVVKIHLPKPAIQEERGGQLSRWLRAAAVANFLT